MFLLLDFPKDQYAEFPAEYHDKEYVFVIDREGVGVCICETDRMDAVQKEDPAMVVKAIVGDSKAAIRLFDIEEEFLAEVQLPKSLADLIWIGWDELLAHPDDDERGRITPETEAREVQLDTALAPYIESAFPECDQEAIS